MHARYRCCAALCLGALTAGAHAQPVRYVDASAAPGGDGRAWASAYDDLHEALLAAGGDPNVTEIWVADGVYATGGTPFGLVDDVAVLGGFAGSETQADQRAPQVHIATLDGSSGGSAVVDVGANAGAVLDGFTITSAGQSRGLTASASNALIADCAIVGNTSVPSGGGAYVASGAPRFLRCRFADNRTNDRGGAVYLAQADGLFVGCTFEENTAFNGGAFGSDSGTATFDNCLLVMNTANFGGAAYTFGGTLALRSCTVAFNYAVNTGGGLYQLQGALSIVNSIVYSNTAVNHPQIRGAATIDYSCVEGGAAGVGNVAGPPRFISVFTGDYRLERISPCIDAGDSTRVPADGLDFDGDGDTAERIPLDLDGHARIFDVGSVVDSGVADPPDHPAVVDIGAYEDNDDCNGNGISDAIDIGDGTSLDCNANDTPDECELDGNDCNNDSIPDDCQLDGNDCNGNGLPDDCDIASGASEDCNANGTPDECELASNDCNINGVPDDCDIAAGAPDCQPDGVPDACQLRDGAEPFYAYDDGSGEFNIGLSPDVYVAWLTRFHVQPGVETVGGISIAYGTITPGRPVTVYLWSDPDGDGDPTDARVLASAVTAAANPNSSTFNDIELDPTYVGPAGTSFFVGAITRLPVGEPACAQDTTSSAGEGWLMAHESVPGNDVPIDPNDLMADVPQDLKGRIDGFGYPGNWLIRALAPPANDCNSNGIIDSCDCAADVDGDGEVGLNDLLTILAHFGETGVVPGDANCDLVVDLSDLLLLLGTFGAACP